MSETQVDPFAAFGEVKKIDTSEAEIPQDVMAGFDAAAVYFAERTNTHKLSVTKDSEDAAKTFYRQVKRYAEEHGLSTLPKRDGKTVTFRFSRPKATASE